MAVREMVIALVQPGRRPTTVEGHFWLDDVQLPDGQMEIQVFGESQKNVIKCTQPYGQTSLVCPIDGPKGVFEKRDQKLPIGDLDESRFAYTWKNGSREEQKLPGDCDALVVGSRCLLMEFKTQTTSHTEDQVANNANKAEAQLARSLAYFREIKQVPVSGCCVIAPHTLPRYKAQASTRSVRFLRKHGTPLFYKDTKDEIELFPITR